MANYTNLPAPSPEQACAMLGHATAYGLGTPADASAATTILAASCTRGHAPSCLVRAELELELDPQLADADFIAELGGLCLTEGLVRACFLLGELAGGPLVGRAMSKLAIARPGALKEGSIPDAAELHTRAIYTRMGDTSPGDPALKELAWQVFSRATQAARAQTKDPELAQLAAQYQGWASLYTTRERVDGLGAEPPGSPSVLAAMLDELLPLRSEQDASQLRVARLTLRGAVFHTAERNLWQVDSTPDEVLGEFTKAAEASFERAARLAIDERLPSAWFKLAYERLHRIHPTRYPLYPRNTGSASYDPSMRYLTPLGPPHLTPTPSRPSPGAQAP
ncbi:MAG: hypothetical protein AAGI01_17900 [Myxococcota bacterium]